MVGVTIFIYILIFFLFIAVYFGYKEKWIIVWWILGIEVYTAGSFSIIIRYGVRGGWF